MDKIRQMFRDANPGKVDGINEIARWLDEEIDEGPVPWLLCEHCGSLKKMETFKPAGLKTGFATCECGDVRFRVFFIIGTPSVFQDTDSISVISK